MGCSWSSQRVRGSQQVHYSRVGPLLDSVLRQEPRHHLKSRVADTLSWLSITAAAMRKAMVAATEA